MWWQVHRAHREEIGEHREKILGLKIKKGFL